MKTFDKYMQEIHADEIRFTENDRLDDSLADAFDEWLEEMDKETLIKHADRYADLKSMEAYSCGYADASRVALGVVSKFGGAK